MIPLAVFLFGLVLGSFLNVCIVRIPAGISIVRPRSRCPKCHSQIKALDNIPVLSWLILRRRCRTCGASISALYPGVELLTGIAFLACYFAFGLTFATAKWAAFCAVLIVLVFTDVRERILPDKVNYFGFALALAFSFLTRPVDGTSLWLANRIFEFPPPVPVLSFVDALLGGAFGSGILWVVAELYFRLRGREGMGFGDVKMMLMAGSFLGLKRTVLTILLGSLLGSVIGLAVILLAKKSSDYELPFGTFLGIGALLVVFFGTPVVLWYQSLLAAR